MGFLQKIKRVKLKFKKMKNVNYNGWSNYATWRINLEVFDGMEFEEKVDAEFLQELAEEIIFDNGNATSLCENYAYAFLSDVNYHEIAEHIKNNF